MLARRGRLAARPRRAVRLRARPVLDPGAVPGVRDRRVARRAEDERHHAGHRPRHAPARRRALHVPAPVPGRTDGAARRRGGLRGADGDRHPGDPRPRADRQHRRRRADLHQPAAAAGAAVLYRRQRAQRPSAACARSAKRHRGKGLGACGRSSTASRRATGRSARSPCRWRWRRRASPSRQRLKIGDLDPGAPELRPSSRYNQDNAYITSHYALSSDQFARDREDGEGRLPQVRNAGRRRSAGVGAAAGARCADDGLAGRRRAADHRRLVRGQSEVADAQPQPGRAELRGAAGVGQQPRSVQHRVLGDAGHRVPRRSQGRDAFPGRGRRRGVRARRTTTRIGLSCWPPAAPVSRRRPTSSSSRRTARCCCTSTPR